MTDIVTLVTEEVGVVIDTTEQLLEVAFDQVQPQFFADFGEQGVVEISPTVQDTEIILSEVAVYVAAPDTPQLLVEVAVGGGSGSNILGSANW